MFCFVLTLLHQIPRVSAFFGRRSFGAALYSLLHSFLSSFLLILLSALLIITALRQRMICRERRTLNQAVTPWLALEFIL
jgi:hypothetical protein